MERGHPLSILHVHCIFRQSRSAHSRSLVPLWTGLQLALRLFPRIESYTFYSSLKTVAVQWFGSLLSSNIEEALYINLRIEWIKNYFYENNWRLHWKDKWRDLFVYWLSKFLRRCIPSGSCSVLFVSIFTERSNLLQLHAERQCYVSRQSWMLHVRQSLGVLFATVRYSVCDIYLSHTNTISLCLHTNLCLHCFCILNRIPSKLIRRHSNAKQNKTLNTFTCTNNLRSLKMSQIIRPIIPNIICLLN